MFEHISVFLEVLFYLRRVCKWHNGICVTFQPADFPFGLFFESDIGDEVEVGSDAKALMGPNMEVELVIPIGDVMFFEDGETPQPVYFLLLFPHIR